MYKGNTKVTKSLRNTGNNGGSFCFMCVFN